MYGCSLYPSNHSEVASSRWHLKTVLRSLPQQNTPPTMKRIKPTAHSSPPRSPSRWMRRHRERKTPIRLTYTRSVCKPPGLRRYQVSRVMAVRRTKTGKQFLLRWKGFGPTCDTWEPQEHCDSCPLLIERFMARHAALKRKKKRVGPRRVLIKKASSTKLQLHTSASTTAVTTVTTKVPIDSIATGQVDKHAAVDGVSVVQLGGCSLGCSLKYVDIATNSDKFYVLQVLHSAVGGVSLFQRWGRSGSGGQSQLTPMSTAEQAVAAFQRVFHDKTGTHWAAHTVVCRQPGKYWPIVVGSEARNGSWEYYQSNQLDGKSPGWYPYTATASAVVEDVHAEWRTNPGSGLSVRCVQSGYFSYRVDFGDMTQRNLSTGTQRPIRRGTPAEGNQC